MSLSFDKVAKVMTVLAPDTEITIQNLLNDIREYEDELDSMDIPKIVSCAGKEPLGGGVVVGLTLTLLDDWQLAFEARSGPTYIQCTVSGGNIVATNVNGSIYPTAFTQVLITASSSATQSDLEAIQYSSYGGGVSVDVVNGTAGIEYPVGNQENPVDNIPDARTIATTKGFKSLFIRGDITLGSGDNISTMLVIGENASRSMITIEDEALTNDCEINNAYVTGILDQGIIIRQCMIENLTYVDGVIFETMLNPGTITLGNNSTGHFLDCYSGVPGQSTPIIDCGGSGQSLAMRNYNGGVHLINKTGSDAVSIDLNSGQVILDSTVTGDGDIVIRGVGKLTDNSNGANVLADDLLNNESIGNMVWDDDISTRYTPNSAATALKAVTYEEHVTIDTVNGTAGTGWPIGTHYSPVDNLADALTIMSRGNIDKLFTHTDLTITTGSNIDGLLIETEGLMDTTVTLESGCSAHKAAFRYVNIEGVVTNGDQILVENCSVGNLENFTGIMNNVSLSQSAEISVGYWATIIDVTAGGDPTNEPEINIGTGSLNIAGLSGNIKLTGKTGTNRSVVNCDSGNILIASSCVAGTIQLLGMGQIENDNSGAGCNVDSDGFLSIVNITEDLQADIKRLLGLSHENIELSSPIYDGDDNLTSCLVRIYSNASSVGTVNDIISSYTITSISAGANKFSTWKSVKN